MSVEVMSVIEMVGQEIYGSVISVIARMSLFALYTDYIYQI